MEGLTKLGINLQSIILYLVNFGILLAVLTKLLYRPIIGYLDRRREEIKNSITEAERLKNEFQKKIDQIHKEKEETHATLRREIEEMKKYTEQKKAEMVKEMELERARLLEQTQHEIEKRKQELIAQAEKKLLELIKKITLDILQNKIPQEVIEESVKDSWQKLKSSIN